MNRTRLQAEPRRAAVARAASFGQSAFNEICGLFAERAAAVDTGGPMGELIRNNLLRLASFGFYGSGIAPEYGGFGLLEAARRDAVERIAAACGATAFAQNQLHAGGGFVSGAADERIKQELLPALARGETLCGVAFAHLRRPGKPQVTAAPVAGGWVINGNAPWISVWSILDAFILGAAVEGTGEALFCYVDRHVAEQGGMIEASAPMQLAVMTAADTVSLTLRDLFVPADRTLQRREPGYMQRSDYASITSHVTLPLGCARGSAGFLSDLAAKQPQAELAAARLREEIDQCRRESVEWSGSLAATASGEAADDYVYKTNALRVRAEAISLALRAAEATIAASGGRAHLLDHPAQRRLREAGFYATMAMTTDTQTALMETFTHAC